MYAEQNTRPSTRQNMIRSARQSMSRNVRLAMRPSMRRFATSQFKMSTEHPRPPLLTPTAVPRRLPSSSPGTAMAVLQHLSRMNTGPLQPLLSPADRCPDNRRRRSAPRCRERSVLRSRDRCQSRCPSRSVIRWPSRFPRRSADKRKDKSATIFPDRSDNSLIEQSFKRE